MLKTKENKKSRNKGIKAKNNLFVSSKTANQGITLVALVITIVVLLILAGITITLVFSENGIIKRAINAKGANEEGAVKDEIALALLKMRADKYDEVYSLENIKTWLPEYLENRELGELSIESGKILGQYKGYEFEINNKFDISYIGKMTGIRIGYTLNPDSYTKDDIILTINATSTQGTIENIEGPEGLTKNENGTYTITTNGTYTFKATDSAGNDKTRDIIINTIDRLNPKDFTPTVIEIGYDSLTIKANAEDEEPKTEADGIKSGIDRYEYCIKETTDEEYTKYESTQGEYTVNNLDVGTEYTIYVIAYDKANNPKTSSTIKETTIKEPTLKEFPIPGAKITINEANATVQPLEYPILTLNGVMNCELVPNAGESVTLEILDEVKENNKYYYSIDGGSNWTEYTGIVNLNYPGEDLIKVKTIYKGTTSSSIKTIKLYFYDENVEATARDSVNLKTYDRNVNSYQDFSKRSLRRVAALNIAPEVIGKKLTVKLEQKYYFGLKFLNSQNDVITSPSSLHNAEELGRGEWIGTYWYNDKDVPTITSASIVIPDTSAVLEIIKGSSFESIFRIYEIYIEEE